MEPKEIVYIRGTKYRSGRNVLIYSLEAAHQLIQQPENLERIANEAMIHNRLFEGIGHLPYKHQKVIILYYGLGDCREHTILEIAPIIGVTHQRTDQILHKALQRLRTYFHRHNLNPSNPKIDHNSLQFF